LRPLLHRLVVHNIHTMAEDSASTSPTFREYCDKLRANDPTVLPRDNFPFKIGPLLSEREHIELADALTQNTLIERIFMELDDYTERSAKAMAEYFRASEGLRCVILSGSSHDPTSQRMLSCLLLALQERPSLKELSLHEVTLGSASKEIEALLINTKSLQKLHLAYSWRLNQEELTRIQSGLKKNTTLQAITLSSTLPAILQSLRTHPRLKTLHVRVGDLTGLDALLLCKKSKITEVSIERHYSTSKDQPLGLTPVLEALGRKATLTMLTISGCRLRIDQTRKLNAVLHKHQELQSLDLTSKYFMSSDLAELGPALYEHASIKTLNLSYNGVDDTGTQSGEILGTIIRRNKTMTKLVMYGSRFGGPSTAPTVIRCIADGLSTNTSLQEFVLANSQLGDEGVSLLAQGLGSSNSCLQKLDLGNNGISSIGIRALLDVIIERDSRIADIDLSENAIGSEGASFLADALGRNTVPHLTRLRLRWCNFGDDGLIEFVSALERNRTMVELDLLWNDDLTERSFLALANSLPDIKTLQRLDLSWCTGLASTMPSVLEALHKNTSLCRLNTSNWAPDEFPPTAEETSRCTGGWIEEMKYVGYRNSFLPLLRAPVNNPAIGGIWSHSLAKVATLPDVLFHVLRAKPDLRAYKHQDP
jgi:Ran GTPase-activating protein (RanGAP) involved in mRNA processing and transport